MCGEKMLWVCTVCSTSVEAKGKSAHSRTSKHKQNSQIVLENTPKSLIQEVLPNTGLPNTFITLKGIALSEDSQIVWNEVVLQTFFCKKEGTLHCFSPASTQPTATIYVITNNQPSNCLVYCYVQNEK